MTSYIILCNPSLGDSVVSVIAGLWRCKGYCLEHQCVTSDAELHIKTVVDSIYESYW